MSLGGPADIGLRMRVVVRTLRDEDAAGTLAAMQAGRVSRGLLPWIPLLRGSGEEGTINKWAQVAASEPDRRLRSDYGGLARVFARLTPKRSAWTRALEGWEMPKSPVVEEWRQEGRLEGRIQAERAKLIEAIELKFHTEVPAELREAIETMTDAAELDRWFRLVFSKRSLPAYRKAVCR